VVLAGGAAEGGDVDVDVGAEVDGILDLDEV
jgi:hypothetical protein